MREYSEVIYGTQRSELYPTWGECIRKDNKRNTTLYLCVFQYPEDGKLQLDGAFTAHKATLLKTGEELKMQTKKGHVVVTLPKEKADRIATIVKLELKGKLPPVKLISNSEKVFKILDAE
jgi:alpha-L-fucosidase